MAEKRLPSPYEDYAVDESGKVWSYKRGEKSEVAARPDAGGYLRVNLSNSEEPNGFKDVRVHELVCAAYCGPKPSPDHEVLHANDDPGDNRASNLSWGTKAENGEDRADAKESYSPPEAAQNAAKRGLELRRKFGRGGTEVGVARARDLANGRNLSAETVGRMRSFFARHGAQKVAEGWNNSEDPSAQWIAWLLWGGDAGRTWVEGLKREDEDEAGLLRIDSTFNVGEWAVTPEGYLEATAVVARVGELVYEGPDGPYTEFVTEDALKNNAESLVGKPITFEHPPEGEVTAENFREYAVGIVQDARYDADLKAQVAKIIVHDADTIKRVVQENIREVSPGYRATLRGNQQVRRANNHVAITKAGRGGPESAIRLDSMGHVVIPTREDEMENEEMKAQMDALMAEKMDMQRKMDAMQAKIDAYEAMAQKKADQEGLEEPSEVEAEAPQMDSKTFVRLFNERQEILELAARKGLNLDSELTNEQMKTRVVKSVLGEDVRCDSIEAVNGMFEAVVKMTPKKNSPEHLGSVVSRNDSFSFGEASDKDPFAFYDEVGRNDSLFNFGKE